MVLTRRAAKCIFRYLPNELLWEISKTVLIPDLVALSRVSRLFYSFATWGLYRCVYLQDGAFSKHKSSKDVLSLFLRTVSQKPSLADKVRVFVFEGSASSSRSLISILERLNQLHTLDICLTELDAEGHNLTSIAGNLAKLRTFRVITLDGDTLPQLLPSSIIQNECLNVLSLNACYAPTQPPPTLRFPNLHHFRGHMCYVPTILEHSSELRSLSVVFAGKEYSDTEVNHAFATVTNSNALKSGALSFLWIQDHVDLFRHSPRVYECIPDILIAKYDFMGSECGTFEDLMTPEREQAMINGLSTKKIGLFSLGQKTLAWGILESTNLANRCLQASPNLQFCMISFGMALQVPAERNEGTEQRILEVITDHALNWGMDLL